MRRAARGHALLGFLFLVGLTATVVAALMLRSGLERTTLLWLLGGVALAATAAAAMARRDRVALLQLLLFCTVMPALILGLWALFASGPQTTVLLLCGGCALLAAGCGLLLRRELGRAELLPNVLLGLAPPAQILEVEGVQLTAGLARLSSGRLVLQVHVQSCVDQPRTLRLKLAAAATGRIAHAAQVEAQLGPAEVGLLRVPLFPRPGEREPGRIYLTPQVEGAPAARMRHWRGRPFQERVHPLKQLLLVFGGLLVWGGGWSVPVPGLADAAPPPEPLPPADWELLWRPSPAAEGAPRLS